MACLLLPAVASAAPLRLAQVPLITRAWCPDEVRLSLEKQMDRAAHVPLNGYLQWVEYLPEAEVMVAFDYVQREKGYRAKYKELVKPLAEKLQADMVVLPVLTGYQQWSRMSWRRGLITYCYASVDLYVYDARTDEVVKKSASRTYNGESSTQGSAAVLAREALDQVLRESRLHERIYPSKEKRSAQLARTYPA